MLSVCRVFAIVEVNVISSSVVDDLFPVVRGKIKLKPFFRDPITADLVCLSMSLPDKDAINVWCAVVISRRII